ncbi:MAG: GTPase Era [Bacilli bacterium]|nr:GTPase Era [Bacilli bacterium]
MRTGFVSIVGRPNVGKSTLLNNILKRHIAITSDKSGTTRNIIQGVYNDNDSQIIFVDTPGIHKPKHKLGTILNKKAYAMTNDIDLILFLVDIKEGFGKGDQFILEKLKQENKDVILLLTKIDKIPNKEILLKEIDKLKNLYDFKEIIPISSIKNINIDSLLKTIKKYLHDDITYYDENYITNQPTSMIITELVREKILRETNDEVPHSVTCYLEEYEEEENIINMGVLIIVDRDNLKKIIIGKNGDMLKKIGTSARLDLEEYFNKKVYLSLYVKTIKNWRDREKYLQELGLKDDLDFE